MEHMAMTGGTFGFQSWGQSIGHATAIWWMQAMYPDKHPTIYRTFSHNKKLSGPKYQYSWNWENLVWELVWGQWMKVNTGRSNPRDRSRERIELKATKEVFFFSALVHLTLILIYMVFWSTWANLVCCKFLKSALKIIFPP